MEIEIYTTIKKNIEQIMERENNRLIITPKSDIIKDIDFDSFEVLTLFCCLERDYKIIISDIEAQTIDTIESLIKLIEFKLETNEN